MTAGAAAAFLAFVDTWAPHEDETLALFVGRGSLGGVVDTVLFHRGGAPVHFVLAWAVVHLGGGLTALRLVSALFAAASLPVVALLGARLADRAAGAVAAALAATNWLFLFHGLYGRMYTLFLFTSALSYLALLAALEHGGRRRFALWGLALLATLGSHPYGAFVLGSQGLFVVLRRVRLRPALATLAIVCAAATPFWIADVVLRGRFDVGVGGGGTRLGSPAAVVEYLRSVARDMSVGPNPWRLAPALLLALVGFVLLARRRRPAALLVGSSIAVPFVALVVVRVGTSTSPETRHLIFLLPFLALLLALPLVEAARLRPPWTFAPAAAALALLLAGGAAWATAKVPRFFTGDPAARTAARETAAAWLAATARPSDVYFGYEPVYLVAWEQHRSAVGTVLPRADPDLVVEMLRGETAPLGRGVWILDAGDTTGDVERGTIPLRAPQPARGYVVRRFGPYLVVRSRRALVTPRRFVVATAHVMRLGRMLEIGDADWNLHTALVALTRL